MVKDVFDNHANFTGEKILSVVLPLPNDYFADETAKIERQWKMVTKDASSNYTLVEHKPKDSVLSNLRLSFSNTGTLTSLFPIKT